MIPTSSTVRFGSSAMAPNAGLPTNWSMLGNAKELIPAVRTHLRRMYWANFNLRLLLLNELAELEYGLRAA